MTRFFYSSIAVFVLLFMQNFAFAGDDVMDKVTEGVCICVQESKDNSASIQGKQFQSCIQKAAKPYMKQLKKMYNEADDAGNEEKFLVKIGLQLGMIMSEKCPDMLEHILQEFPGLQDTE